jgi:hypothetical protein
LLAKKQLKNTKNNRKENNKMTLQSDIMEGLMMKNHSGGCMEVTKQVGPDGNGGEQRRSHAFDMAPEGTLELNIGSGEGVRHLGPVIHDANSFKSSLQETLASAHTKGGSQ